ncbi:glutamate--cysteine ligase catalytic subunit-like [Lineus longissimus]|uniref:glutamate--cysteine ligase catalytic subunit-like n=1 Tax=Lineus longissimus TaxID=88925 RepID=UPI002B4F0548
MGLLSEGSPLTWEETKKLADHVRKHGIQQFINQYHKVTKKLQELREKNHGKKMDSMVELKWGDEVEYILVKFDDENRRVGVNLKATQLMEKLMENEEENKLTIGLWRPEYAEYMVEGTPGKPYESDLAYFNVVESNMKRRREAVLALCNEPDESLLSIVSFPRLGCKNFTVPSHEPTPNAGSSQSLFLPHEIITKGHPRFRTLTRNIRQRRGERPPINIPIFKDTNTPSPFIEDLSVFGDDGSSQKNAKPDHIYLDCMGYGMGMCCLQMTFQAFNISEARLLYDQLAPLCPILLALSAASPIYRGYLSDIECRWNIIAASVDDRTEEERGLKPLKNDKYVIPKSRYDSIDTYLCPCSDKYNDIQLVKDEEVERTLIKGGIDKHMAQHIAHLFIRDPISLFGEKIDQNDEEEMDHFENIQSTNWQTMRFKPPPPNSSIGWRVEFRPTEVQLTDFENAAYAVFIVLMTRAILSFRLNFLIPISKVDENMQTAQKRDAVRAEKFYFRKDITTYSSPRQATDVCMSCITCPEVRAAINQDDSDEYVLMSINEIINGKENVFPGLVPVINEYLSNMEVDIDTQCTIQQYLSLIQKRASGELMTTARWMREFVTSHPEYKKDSVVSNEIEYDLLKKCDGIMRGLEPCPELLGKFSTRTKQDIPPAFAKKERILEEKIGVKNGANK